MVTKPSRAWTILFGYSASQTATPVSIAKFPFSPYLLKLTQQKTEVTVKTYIFDTQQQVTWLQPSLVDNWIECTSKCCWTASCPSWFQQKGEALATTYIRSISIIKTDLCSVWPEMLRKRDLSAPKIVTCSWWCLVLNFIRPGGGQSFGHYFWRCWLLFNEKNCNFIKKAMLRLLFCALLARSILNRKRNFVSAKIVWKSYIPLAPGHTGILFFF
jgi:hypothetical protein